MKYISLIIVTLIFFLVSCNQKGNLKNDIQQMYYSKVSLPLDSMICISNNQDSIIIANKTNKMYKLVSYSDTSTCSSCQLREMKKWNNFLKKAVKYKHNLSVYFIFCPQPKDMDVFKFTIKSISLAYPLYLDSKCMFVRENPHIPKNPKLHTFLLDEQNKVILVGDPSNNDTIEEMFWQIMNKKTEKNK